MSVFRYHTGPTFGGRCGAYRWPLVMQFCAHWWLGLTLPGRHALHVHLKTLSNASISSPLQIFSKAATALGTTGLLTCVAEGAPEVRFSWRREGVLLSSGQLSDKYDNETTKVRFDLILHHIGN